MLPSRAKDERGMHVTGIYLFSIIYSSESEEGAEARPLNSVKTNKKTMASAWGRKFCQ